MNVIVYWKSGGYEGVYDVDDVQPPTRNDPDLHLFRQFKGTKFEVGRFEGEQMKGWQIFLTARDVERNQPRSA
jgi:hypothetical protein